MLPFCHAQCQFFPNILCNGLPVNHLGHMHDIASIVDYGFPFTCITNNNNIAVPFNLLNYRFCTNQHVHAVKYYHCKLRLKQLDTYSYIYSYTVKQYYNHFYIYV